MNPDFPKTPLEELEVRLTALLLDELPDEEAAAWRAAIAANLELAKVYENLKQTISLVGEATANSTEPVSAPAAPLKLSEERRQKLLTHFKTVAPKELVPEKQRPKFRLVELAAVLVIVGFLAAISFPAVSNFRRRERGSVRTTFSSASEAKYAADSAPDVVRAEVVEQALSGPQPNESERPAQLESLEYSRPPTSPAKIVLPSGGNSASAGDTKRTELTVGQNYAWAATPPPAAEDGAQLRYYQDLNRGAVIDPTTGLPATTPESSFADYLADAQRRLADKSGGGIVDNRVQVSGQVDSFYRDLSRSPAPTLRPRTAGETIAKNGVDRPTRAGRGISPTTESVDRLSFGEVAATVRGYYADDNEAFSRSYGLESRGRETGALSGGAGGGGGGGAIAGGAAFAAPQTQPGQAVAGDVVAGVVASPAPAFQPAKPQEPPAPTLAAPTDVNGDKVSDLAEMATLGKLFRGDAAGYPITPPASSPVPNASDPSLGTRFYDFDSDGFHKGLDNVNAWFDGGVASTGGTAGRGNAPRPDHGIVAQRGTPQVAAAEESLRRESSSIVLPPIQTETSLAQNGRNVAARTPRDGVAPIADTTTESLALVQEGRRLLEAGKQEVAEVQLKDTIKPEPEGRAANYYLSLAKEQRLAEAERRGGKDSKKDIAQVEQALEMPPEREKLSELSIAARTDIGQAEKRLEEFQQPRTNLVFTSGGRQNIVSKLDRIRFDQVTFEQLGLGEVLRSLSDEAKKRDPEKKGINLLVTPETPAAVDPTTGLPVAAAPVVDINTVAVNLSVKGGDVRLADLLDAIVKGADRPLKYSIEDYAVVFSRADTSGVATNEALLTRTYKIDPNKFYQGLESVGALFVTKTNSMDELQNGVLNFYTTLGVDLAPAKGKAVSWNDRTGTLVVRATQKDLEVIETANQTLGATTAVEQDVAPIRKPATNAPIPQPEIQTSETAFSTFSLNVSDVSFKLAAASLEQGQMPDPASVRSEEFINAFDYRDPEAPPGVPIAFAWERARYPFAHNRDLLRFSVKTAAAGRQAGRPLNIVLLLDNSGSMERADRIQIIREALRVLATQLQPQDKLSVISFARTARLWVDGVSGDKAGDVADQISSLTPQGGTNFEEGMNTAYATALRHYVAGGINRVVMLTDGAANLGNVEPESLKQKVEAHRKQGIALDCFGIGWEGFNDDLLETLSRNGDGRYGFINSPEEAATEFAGQLAGALKVAASDVKVQVEFNPARVTAYRQIGYAKHQLTKEQFRDNTVDAAEIAAQEAGNALYAVEVNPAGEGPLAIVRVRFKIPGTSDYREHEWAVPYGGGAVSLEQASPVMRLAATASAFSEWLVASPFAGEVTPDSLLGYLSGVPEIYGADARPKKLEWMIRQAKSIAGK